MPLALPPPALVHRATLSHGKRGTAETVAIMARLAMGNGRGVTEYVLRHGKPLLADPHEIDRLVALDEISQFGTRSVCWLGVPLVWGGKALGVLAVQSYSPGHTYNERDQDNAVTILHAC